MLVLPKPSPLLKKLSSRKTLFLSQAAVVDSQSPTTLKFYSGNDVDHTSVEIKSLHSIVAIGEIEFSCKAISLLLQSKIPIIFFTNFGELLGELRPNYSNSSDCKKLQIDATETQKLHLAKVTVWEALRNSRRFLLRQKREKREAEGLDTVIQEIDFAVDGAWKADNIDSIQGCLGAGMFVYYPYLAKCIGWDYESRKDNLPFNRMLDFMYDLLLQSCIFSLRAAGLDPEVGFWHKNYGSQKGLASDLALQFMIHVDACVVRAVNRKRIALEYFQGNWSKSHLLPPNVVEVLISEYQAKMEETLRYPYLEFRCTYQEVIDIQAYQISLYLNGEIEEYFPLTNK